MNGTNTIRNETSLPPITGTVVECGYDFRGRRFSKKVSVSGTVSLNQRYVYREFLQIACEDLLRAAQPALWFVLWDPTETVATRPLAIQKDGTWFTFGWDITKNIWELFGPAGYIRTTYSYEPFGKVSMNASGVVQPFRFSSEFYDEELDLVYYNYRHYSPALGRFLSRDPIEEQGGLNLYAFVGNNSILRADYLGREVCWSARELEKVFFANHHFILMTIDDPSKAPKGSVPQKISCKDSCKPPTWVVVVSLTGMSKEKVNFGDIIVGSNYEDDIASFKQKYCGVENRNERNWGYQSHVVSPPNGWTNEEFMR